MSVHGNYHGYYTKRPFLSDVRLALLPLNLFQAARVLDVGCNEGWVTCEIAQSRGARLVVGVDIDHTLIQAAWRRRRAVWSSQTPSRHILNLQVQERESLSTLPRTYFPASCAHEFGSLPFPPSSNRGKTAFPHNLSFRTADWVTTPVPEDAEAYDVVVAFSISKWIHLNSGDQGLKQFFRRVHSVLNLGGTFVLESQPWDSYAKARRMDQKLKENFKSLEIRPADFESILQDIGFSPPKHIGSTGEGGFHRPIDFPMGWHLPDVYFGDSHASCS